MSLYEKYRPTSLTEVFGNSYIVEGLTKHFSNKDHNHSFFFYGPSGCGKTTFGTIISNLVGSKKPDFVHINGADFRGIEMARQINEEAGLRPVISKSRLYMIDEFHQITNQAQNALLDVLERTPSYVYFVLCTTDPDKVINTIKNRCARYRVSPLRRAECFKLVKWVASQEKIELMDEVLEYLCLVSEGVPRTSLNYLEQIRDVTDPEKALDQLEGLVSDQSTFGELLNATISGKRDWKKAFQCVKDMDMEPEQIRRGIMTFCTNKLYKVSTEEQAAFYLRCLRALQPNLVAVNEAQILGMVFELCGTT